MVLLPSENGLFLFHSCSNRFIMICCVFNVYITTFPSSCTCISQLRLFDFFSHNFEILTISTSLLIFTAPSLLCFLCSTAWSLPYSQIRGNKKQPCFVPDSNGSYVSPVSSANVVFFSYYYLPIFLWGMHAELRSCHFSLNQLLQYFSKKSLSHNLSISSVTRFEFLKFYLYS